MGGTQQDGGPELEQVRADNESLRKTNDALVATITTLQSTIESLSSELAAQREAFEDQKKALEKALETLEYLQRRFLRKKSEKKVTPPAEEARAKKGLKPDREQTTEKRKKKAKQRAQVETKRVFHPVPEDQRRCPHCHNEDLGTLGKGRTTKTWEYVPGFFRCYEHVQETLTCDCGDYVVTAPPPPRPFENARYGPRFIAHLVVSKLLDSIPVHRMEKRFERLGIPMSRSTMNDLLHRMAEELAPLVAALFAAVATAPVVLADETSIKIQDREKRGFVWTFVTPDVVTFKLSLDRSGATPQEVLGGTEGVLLIDGYTGYNKVLGVDGRIAARCNSHARRKFFEAKEQAPEVVDEILDLYLEVYLVERAAKELGVYGTDAHLQMRQSESRHYVELLHERLIDELPLHPPRSKLGKAIRYALKYWEGLTYFLENPEVPVDNNESESQLRKIALGRVNWLFFGNEDAGKNLVGLLSLIATCVKNGINPEEYLADVIMRLADHPQSELEQLLPHRWAPP